MANISDKKLYAPIQNVRLADREYIELAKKIAKKIVHYDPEGVLSNYSVAEGHDELMQELAEVRMCASDDREILKGDFVILCYIDLFREQLLQEQRVVEGKGKFLKISDKLIREIFENHLAGGKVTDFCTQKLITRTKYYRILNIKLKQERDIERVARIRAEVMGK